MMKVAILGHGVVGSGVAEILRENAAHIAEKAGDSIEIKRILDLREFPELPYADLFTKRFEDIAEDDEIGIVVETMGGLHPAYEFVKTCLLAGKSVVTSNKELVAQKGDELLNIAKEHNLNFLFEASVGGGIPVLRPLAQCLSANNVLEIAGILNGTTNFMLTKMIDNGMQFDDALKLAQDLGYAERDPSADVDGLDACRKICILAALAFGRHVYPDSVTTEGIRNVSLTDVQYAAELGGVIKLIGYATEKDGKVYCSVAPRMVKNSNLLSGVKDVFNAVMVNGDSVGEVVFYGKGAGKLPTASAVVADVIDEVKHVKARKYLGWDAADAARVGDPKQLDVSMMVRASGSLDAVKAVFGDVQTAQDVADNEFAFITPKMCEAELVKKLETLDGATVISRFRVV